MFCVVFNPFRVPKLLVISLSNKDDENWFLKFPLKISWKYYSFFFQMAQIFGHRIIWVPVIFHKNKKNTKIYFIPTGHIFYPSTNYGTNFVIVAFYMPH